MHPFQIEYLLRDRAYKLHEIEAEYGVSISLQKDTSEAVIYGTGDRQGAINALEEVAVSQKKRIANTVTLKLQVNSGVIPRIIGRAGSTINQIRDTSCIDRITIPRDRDRENENTIVEIEIIGLQDCVVAAQEMINKIIADYQPSRQPK